MKLKLFMGILLAIGLSACGGLFSKPATISGYVVDMKAGEPVAGVTVRIAQTGETAQTDDAGHYSIETTRGRYTLTFSKGGYATSRVEGLLTLEPQTTYSTILRPVFDPEGPLQPPQLNVVVPEWYEPGDEVTITVSGTVANPEVNGFRFLDIALGQQGGSSGYLNGYVRHERFFGYDGEEVRVTLPTTGYTGMFPVHVVAYDVNGNRTEVIRYVYRNPDPEAPVPAAPSELSAVAVTFGDVAVFGPLSVPDITGTAVLNALKAGDVETLQHMGASLRSAIRTNGGIALQGESLKKAITWVDLEWTYDPASDAPEAFEIFRKNGENGDFVRIGRIAAEDALEDPDTGAHAFRDATPGTFPGTLLTYRVEAVNGEERSASNEFSLTPLPAFHVEAVSPADNTTDVELAPGYVISVQNSSSVNVFRAIVLDRVQADGFNIAYLSPYFFVDGADGEFHPFSDFGFYGIPHGVEETEGGYALSGDVLQPFHTYDWQPLALTLHVNDDGVVDAVSIGSDFFGLLSPFGVQDGPINTFVTGSGAAPVVPAAGVAEGR